MSRPEETYPLSDLSLARRLEEAEARRGAAFVEARSAVAPDRGACWTRVAGAYALFDGIGSPITQTFGLGLFEPVGPGEMDALEAFFAGLGSEALHEISPLADPSMWPLLADRGHRPIEFTSILVRPVAIPPPEADSPVMTRLIEPGEEGLWARVGAQGWCESEADAAFVREIGVVVARSEGALCFLAELDGRPIGTAALGVAEGVAHLAGASTIPEARNRGAQRALLRARLRSAGEAGCELATMGALPGSTSQKNAERQGFRIAYTRVKWGPGAPRGV